MGKNNCRQRGKIVDAGQLFKVPFEKACLVINEIADQFKPDIPKPEKQTEDASIKEKTKAEDKKTPIKLTPEEIRERIKELLGDMPNGYKTIDLKSGAKYVGELKNGLIHGQGVWVNPDGNSYAGEWKDGKRHGQGTEIWGTTKYVGEWKDGKENGQGTITGINGIKYVGEWKDGKRNGQGTITGINIKYIGEWKDGKENGQGTLTGTDDSKYVGEWKNGTYHGQGTYTYVNGDTYVGEWKDGKRNGLLGSE